MHTVDNVGECTKNNVSNIIRAPAIELNEAAATAIDLGLFIVIEMECLKAVNNKNGFIFND